MKASTEPFEIYLPFTSDYGFKVTFGNEHNTLFLRHALSALIGKEIPLEAIWFEKNTFEGTTSESRGGVLDLYCRDVDGNSFIVEMQLGKFPRMVQRLKFYGYHKLDTFVRKGKFQFEGIPKIYCIGILGFNLLQGDHYHTTAFLQDVDGRKIDDQMEFIFVELEKFDKSPDLCSTDLEKLIFIMKEAHKFAAISNLPDFMSEDWIKTALHELDTRALSPDDRAMLSMRVAKEISERHRVANLEKNAIQQGFSQGMEKGFEAGMEKGIEKGMEKGIEKGIEKGMEKGMEKGAENANRNAVKNLILSTGWDDAKIAEVLSLSLTFVQSIRMILNSDID